MSPNEVFDPRRWTPPADDQRSARAVQRAKLVFAALAIERLKGDLADLVRQLEALDITHGFDVLGDALEDVDEVVMQELLGPTLTRAAVRAGEVRDDA